MKQRACAAHAEKEEQFVKRLCHQCDGLVPQQLNIKHAGKDLLYITTCTGECVLQLYVSHQRMKKEWIVF